MRKCIGENPLSAAEKQARYRERKKLEGFSRQEQWVNPRTEKAKARIQEMEAEARLEDAKKHRKELRNKEKMELKFQGRISCLLLVCHFLHQKKQYGLVVEIVKYFGLTLQDCIRAKIDQPSMHFITPVFERLEKDKGGNPLMMGNQAIALKNL